MHPQQCFSQLQLTPIPYTPYTPYPSSKHILPGHREVAVVERDGGKIAPAPDALPYAVQDPGVPDGGFEDPDTLRHHESLGMNGETEQKCATEGRVIAGNFFQTVFDMDFIHIHHRCGLLYIAVTVAGSKLEGFRYRDTDLVVMTPINLDFMVVAKRFLLPGR